MTATDIAGPPVAAEPERHRTRSSSRPGWHEAIGGARRVAGEGAVASR